MEKGPHLELLIYYIYIYIKHENIWKIHEMKCEKSHQTTVTPLDEWGVYHWTNENIIIFKLKAHGTDCIEVTLLIHIVSERSCFMLKRCVSIRIQHEHNVAKYHSFSFLSSLYDAVLGANCVLFSNSWWRTFLKHLTL